MTEQTTMTREKQLLEQFKEGLDPQSAMAMQLRLDALEARQEEIEASAAAERESSDAAQATLLGRAEAAEAEVATLRRQLAAQKGETTKARNAAPKPAKARALGAAGTGDTDMIREFLADGGCELILSDGKHEILELDSVPVDADMFERRSDGRLLFTGAVLVKGDAGGKQLSIAGAALVDEDGDQIGWAGLPEPVTVAPGTTVKLERSFEF